MTHSAHVSLRAGSYPAPAARSAGDRALLAATAAAVVALALALRLLLFEGMLGSDDLHHVLYAMAWDRPPADHLETRLLYNGLLRLSILGFGAGEAAYAVPGLVASALFCASTVVCAGAIAGMRAAALAGVLAACLPIDITYATVPTSLATAAGLSAAGTAALWVGERPRALAAAAVLLALSVLTHLSAILWVGILGVGALLGPHERRAARVAAVCGAVALAAVLELALFAAVTGDPLHELRTIERTHMPKMASAETTRSLADHLRPLSRLLFSKELGVLLAVGCGLALLGWRRLDTRLRVAAATALGLFLWVHWGTQTPARWLPLRAMRFVYFAALPLCVVCGALLAARARVGVAAAAGLAVLGIAVAASAGPWGQRIEITRAFLRFVDAHRGTVFLTEAVTLDEVLALRGRPAPNLARWDQPIPRDARPVAVLVNPLARTPMPERLVLGETLFETPRRLRDIACFVPSSWVADDSVLVRQPRARIAALERVR